MESSFQDSLNYGRDFKSFQSRATEGILFEITDPEDDCEFSLLYDTLPPGYPPTITTADITGNKAILSTVDESLKSHRLCLNDSSLNQNIHLNQVQRTTDSNENKNNICTKKNYKIKCCSTLSDGDNCQIKETLKDQLVDQMDCTGAKKCQIAQLQSALYLIRQKYNLSQNIIDNLRPCEKVSDSAEIIDCDQPQILSDSHSNNTNLCQLNSAIVNCGRSLQTGDFDVMFNSPKKMTHGLILENKNCKASIGALNLPQTTVAEKNSLDEHNSTFTSNLPSTLLDDKNLSDNCNSTYISNHPQTTIHRKNATDEHNSTLSSNLPQTTIHRKNASDEHNSTLTFNLPQTTIHRKNASDEHNSTLTSNLPQAFINVRKPSDRMSILPPKILNGRHLSENCNSAGDKLKELIIRANAQKHVLTNIVKRLDKNLNLPSNENNGLWRDMLTSKNVLQMNIEEAQSMHRRHIFDYNELLSDPTFDPDLQLFELICYMGQLELWIQDQHRAFKTHISTPCDPPQATTTQVKDVGFLHDNAQLELLEKEYLSLMCRYQDVKSLPTCPALVTESRQLAHALRIVCRNARGLRSKVIDTEEELEWTFQLDAEYRQAALELDAIRATTQWTCGRLPKANKQNEEQLRFSLELMNDVLPNYPTISTDRSDYSKISSCKSQPNCSSDSGFAGWHSQRPSTADTDRSTELGDANVDIISRRRRLDELERQVRYLSETVRLKPQGSTTRSTINLASQKEYRSTPRPSATKVNLAATVFGVDEEILSSRSIKTPRGKLRFEQSESFSAPKPRDVGSTCKCQQFPSSRSSPKTEHACNKCKRERLHLCFSTKNHASCNLGRTDLCRTPHSDDHSSCCCLFPLENSYGGLFSGSLLHRKCVCAAGLNKYQRPYTPCLTKSNAGSEMSLLTRHEATIDAALDAAYCMSQLALQLERELHEKVVAGEAL